MSDISMAVPNQHRCMIEPIRKIQRYIQGLSDFCERPKDSEMLMRADEALEQLCDVYLAAINIQPEKTNESAALWEAIGRVNDGILSTGDSGK